MNRGKGCLWMVSLLVAWLFTGVPTVDGQDDDLFFQQARQKMVDRQIRARGVRHQAVVEAMANVPRHRFVPQPLQTMAYVDHPLLIGHEQTISQPYIVAKMSELLDVGPGQKVLEVGTGSGYQAAVLAHMGADVYSIEIIPALGQRARKTLAGLGYRRVHVAIGDGYLGWPDHAPFDGIIVTCAPSHIPQPLQDQLAEGGRLVIPVGPAGKRQELVLLRKVDGKIQKEKVFPVRFVPMKNEKGVNY